jgi:hypothetical protein
MNDLPFDKPGRFYRGNLHMHSTQSDGKYSAEEVCRRYRAAGYDFISITDHAMEAYGYPVTDTSELRTGDFTTLIGAELHAGQSELGHLWHIVANGLPADFDPSSATSGQEAARMARDAGAFVSIAHPAWYILTEADVRSFHRIAHAIEIYNGTAGAMQDRYDSWYIADLVLARGLRFLASASDDFHGQPDRHDFNLGWVWVKSESLDPGAIAAALRAGHFYSSTGPEIFDVRVEPGRVLSVRASTADLIAVTGVGPGAARTTEVDVSEVELDISALESPYLRVTVRDRWGRRAWTNPIWVG